MDRGVGLPACGRDRGRGVARRAAGDRRRAVGRALLAFVGWMTLLVDAVQTLTERIINRGRARAAADRLVTPLAAAPPASGDTPLPRGDVVFDRVGLDRCGRRVLDEVSLRVRRGERVALVGASGSGKSSLLRLLPRLTDPSSGAVRIGGVDVNHRPWGPSCDATSAIPCGHLLVRKRRRRPALALRAADRACR